PGPDVLIGGTDYSRGRNPNASPHSPVIARSLQRAGNLHLLTARQTMPKRAKLCHKSVSVRTNPRATLSHPRPEASFADRFHHHIIKLRRRPRVWRTPQARPAWSRGFGGFVGQ